METVLFLPCDGQGKMGLSGSNWHLCWSFSFYPPPTLLLFPWFLNIVDDGNEVLDIYMERGHREIKREYILVSDRRTGRCSSSGTSL